MAAFSAAGLGSPRSGDTAGALPELQTIADNDTLTVFVIGASGDLAKKKTYPALFELFQSGFLPRQVQVVGYARRDKTDDAFRTHIGGHLMGKPADKEAFLRQCTYCKGGYDSEEGFKAAIDSAAAAEAAAGVGEAHRFVGVVVPWLTHTLSHPHLPSQAVLLCHPSCCVCIYLSCHPCGRHGLFRLGTSCG